MYHASIFFNETNGSCFHGFNPGDSMKRGGMHHGIVDSIQTHKVFNTDNIDNLLREVFAYYNYDNRFNGKYERSLSVGDVIRVCDYISLDNVKYFAVESIGFKEINPDDMVISGKVDSRVCCDYAEKVYCVCSIAYKCPLHHKENGYSCVGSHD